MVRKGADHARKWPGTRRDLNASRNDRRYLKYSNRPPSQRCCVKATFRNWMNREVGKNELESFPLVERRRSKKASAAETESMRALPFGAGLGWRKARRRGLGTAQIPKTERRLNHCGPAA